LSKNQLFTRHFSELKACKTKLGSYFFINYLVNLYIINKYVKQKLIKKLVLGSNNLNINIVNKNLDLISFVYALIKHIIINHYKKQ